MEQNQLRKLAGLPLMEAKKKKDAPVMDDVPSTDDAAPAETPTKDEDGDKDGLPAIVTKLAMTACKKFKLDISDESTDVPAMQDVLMRVYQAGLKDGVEEK